MARLTEKTVNLIKSIMGVRQKKPGLPEQKLCLVVAGLPEDTFIVIDFKSEGGLNRCYRLEATLASDNPAIDLAQVVKSRVFGFSEESREHFLTFKGFVYECEQLHAFEGKYFYRLVLGPKLFFLTHTFHNQIFLDRTTREILEEILTDGGLLWDEFEFRLHGDYSRKWEYVCQYGESHYDFFSRWLEREGLYFFFEPAEEGEKLIITDTVLAHPSAEAHQKLRYHPESGLEYGSGVPILNNFTASHTRTPGSVTVKDYNYRRPSLDLTGTATVDPDSPGEVYIYGDHLQSSEESARIARMRAEGIVCRSHLFKGCSNAGYLRVGQIIEVEGHFRHEYNRRYLITQLTHEGHQQIFLISGLRKDGSDHEKKPLYRNSFTAIPSDIQYRPPLSTQKPRFHGVINAHIDAEGSGKYAEIDKHGRYKVILPFDLAGRKDGKASAWIRMAQPYAGEGHGMHFPLHKGTEVLLTFVDGDPDRPIISAAVPNPLTPSVVNGTNSTQNRITTAGGNKIHLNDRQGGEQIRLQTPKSDSRILLGSLKKEERETFTPTEEEKEKFETAVNDLIDEKLEEEEEKSGISLYSTKGLEVEAAYENKVILGEVTEMILGAELKTVVGAETDTVLGMRNHVTVLDMNEVTLGVIFEFVAAGKIAFIAVAGREFVAEKHLVTAEKKEIHGMNTKIGELELAVQNHATKILQNNTDLCKFAIQATENESNLIKRVDDIAEKHNTLVDMHTELKRSHKSLINHEKKIRKKVDKFDEKVNKITKDQTEMIESAKKIVNQSVTVANRAIYTGKSFTYM